ncbi:MAG: S9 family peptidase, partial [Bacteroidetes bacterium]|nr:S9 family peptidase [Bacteroidota bacterium]
IVWGEKGRFMYFTSGVKARFHIFKLDLKKGDLTQITTGRYNYNAFGFAGKNIVVQRTDMSHAAELFTVDAKKGTATPFTQVNKEIYSNLEFANVREHWIKTTTGEKMHVWLVLPPNFDSTKQYPTLLYCQGGPQSAISNYYSFRWNFELMASQDYIIVAPNRHGVPTFGQEWNHQISGDWGGQAMQDYLTAIDWASELNYVNKNKLGAVGASYGGYSVYWLAGNHEKRFKCLIAHCGLYNLNSWYATTEEMFFANYDLKSTPWSRDWANVNKKFNPASFVKNWDAPILVIHGEKDFRVPVGEGIQAFNSAQLLGVKSRFLYFPDEGHWVLSPQNGLLWHREYFRWLDEHLK